jgi:hypothetical protein
VFPVFVRIIFCEAELPSTTFPKPVLVGFAVSLAIGASEAVPESVMFVVGVVGSLLTIEIPPVMLPVELGTNVAVAVMDWPALIVLGVVTPAIPKSVPARETRDMVRSAPPALPNINSLVPFDPTDTVPNWIDVELNDSFAWGVGATVPESAKTVGVVPAPPSRLIVPLAVPAFVAFSHKVKTVLWFGANVTGNVIPDILNWEFENTVC